MISKSLLYTIWRKQIVTNYRAAWVFAFTLVAIRFTEAILSHF